MPVDLACMSWNNAFCVSGREEGIRTPEGLTPQHAFQACALNHSAIPPEEARTIQKPTGLCNDLKLEIEEKKTVAALTPGYARYDWLWRAIGVVFPDC